MVSNARVHEEESLLVSAAGCGGVAVCKKKNSGFAVVASLFTCVMFGVSVCDVVGPRL